MRCSHLLLIVLILLSLQRCATQTQPQGGPKDSIPPKLLSSKPKNNEKNFRERTVTLNFDEFIKLKDAKEIIITPSPGKNVALLAKNRVLTIEPKNGWHDSTTYSIAFREAVQDITESNPARNLHLAFSTGSTIDSLTISGKISLALKETVPDRITVALYQQDTFNIFRHTPEYFTETNKEGIFKIENLKAGAYHAYAFADKNKNLKADSQSELYGFRADTINLATNRTNIEITLVGVDSRKLKVNNVRHNAKYSTIRLSKPVSDYNLSSMEGKSLLTTYGDNQSEIYLYHNADLHDSVAYTLTAKDSISQTLDTVIFIEASDAKFQKEKFKTSIESTDLATETGNLTVNLKFTLPLLQIRPDTVQLIVDSTYIVKITPADILIDTVKKKASFTCTLNKKNLLALENPVTLYISKNVFISINNDSSTALRVKIPYIKEEETGRLTVEIKTKQPHFLIQLIDKNYKIIQQAQDQRVVTFTYLVPTDYKIRAVIDTNHNGQWDIGSYPSSIEPERIIYLRISPKTFDTPLRANWEATAPVFSF